MSLIHITVTDTDGIVLDSTSMTREEYVEDGLDDLLGLAAIAVERTRLVATARAAS